jgi:hypothetical protein
MTLTQPKSMDECIYFTNRASAGGKVKAWVFRKDCPKCKDQKMGKPRDPKTGKPKIRSPEYVCHECNYIEEKKEHEESLEVCISYTCPHCKFEGETKTQYKRKNIQLLDKETGKKKAAKAIQFKCEKCQEKINITKKMKGQ